MKLAGQNLDIGCFEGFPKLGQVFVITGDAARIRTWDLLLRRTQPRKARKQKSQLYRRITNRSKYLVHDLRTVISSNDQHQSEPCWTPAGHALNSHFGIGCRMKRGTETKFYRKFSATQVGIFRGQHEAEHRREVEDRSSANGA